MNLSDEDLQRFAVALKPVIAEVVKPIVDEAVGASEERTAARIDSAVETLTSQTAEGFNEVTERFKQVDKRFDAIDERFRQSDKNTAELVNGLATHMDGRFETTDKKLDDTKEAFDGLASNYQKLAKEDVASSVVQSRHDEQLKDHERRLTRLEPATA